MTYTKEICYNCYGDDMNSFELKDDRGKVYECDVLMTFENDSKSYMIYTDNELDEDGNVEVLATKYVIEDNAIKLIPIETDEEWELVDSKWGENNV